MLENESVEKNSVYLAEYVHVQSQKTDQRKYFFKYTC